MASRPQPPPPPGAAPAKTGGAWNTTKAGFRAVGQAGTGFRNGVRKLDDISISRSGISTKKQLSAGNVSYDRETHVVAPKQDVSHFAPPPKKLVNAPNSSSTTTKPASAAARSTTAGRPPPPPAPKPRPGTTSGRSVPPPPPARSGASPAPATAATPPPAYNAAAGVGGDGVGGLTSRLGGMKMPSSSEVSGGLASARTVGGLYGKYGGSATSAAAAANRGDTAAAFSALRAAPKPTLAEAKAGYAAANNLNNLHTKYAGTAPTTATAQTPAVVSQVPVTAPAVVAPPPLPGNKPGARGGSVNERVCAFAFDAQAAGDLGMRVGDRILILERTDDEEAWWRGRNLTTGGQEGVFPANYTRPA
ncbi:hypothetical protein PYCC9005_004451 [Savitreella phatthalungensis]